MNHSFNVEVATEYGLNEAILLENIYFWCAKNEANGTNINNGKAWTYNTVSAFNTLFPYLSQHKIAKSLKTLEEKGLVITGVFNQNPYLRTKWYSVTDKAKCYFQVGKMQTLKNANAKTESEKCTIPQSDESYKGTVINTFNKPFINTDTEQPAQKSKPSINYQEIVDLFKKNCPSLPSIRTLTDKRKRAIKTLLKTYTINDITDSFSKVENSDFLTGKNGKWSANFDWLMNTTNMTKVLEGNYSNKEKKGYNVNKADYNQVLTDEELSEYDR